MEHTLQAQAAELIETKTSVLKRVFCILLAVSVSAGGAWLFYEHRRGAFRDIDTFKAFVAGFGSAGPLLLTAFQCVKTVYAVIPSTLGCIVGPVLFGTWKGIICNYIGICAGSFAAFALSRKFGVALVRQVISEKRYQRSVRRMEKWHRSYPVFLWLAILSPVAPDDFLCYFSGLTRMSFRRFAVIILTAKPFTIVTYGVIFGRLFN